ncbi:hypothetical protein AB3N62_10995 [Leptospira sp. WS4.C2]
MRYALFDNATITAIQRLLGEIQIYNKATIDMDIIALESYVEAILFYDYIVCIDDYKKNHSNTRKLYFPEIRFLNPKDINYSDIEKEATNIFQEIKPSIKSGEFEDEFFSEFFNLLKMHMIFTWDMSSSEYFLTQKVLIQESGINEQEYSKIMSGITNEEFLKFNLDNTSKFTPTEFEIQLFDQKGKIDFNSTDYKKSKFKGLSNKFQYFSSSLGWLAHRTIFYTLMSEYLRADLFLHPIRQSFNIVILQKKASFSNSILKPLIDEMNKNAESSLKSIKSLTEPYLISQTIPLFSAWLVNKTQDSRKIIEYAYEVRNNKLFVEARNKLRELSLLVESNDTAKYVRQSNLLVSELNLLFENIKTSFGIGNNQGISTSKFINIYNLTFGLSTGKQLPDFDFKIKALEFLKNFIPKAGFKGVYRSLINDLVSVSRLGKYHELITNNVSLHKDAYFYSVNTEEAKYKGRSSFWKIPMN